MSGNDLPVPGSDELRQLLTREDLRSLYAFLYERRGTPPTMVEIREHAAAENGESHSQPDRRVREMRGWFKLPAVRSGRADSIRGGQGGTSPTVRGEVLSAKRCAQCGKTPAQQSCENMLPAKHSTDRAAPGSNGLITAYRGPTPLRLPPLSVKFEGARSSSAPKWVDAGGSAEGYELTAAGSV